MSADTIIMAIAIAFIFEGIFPTLFPNKWQRYVSKIAQESASNIRGIGLSLIALGSLLLWWIS